MEYKFSILLLNKALLDDDDVKYLNKFLIKNGKILLNKKEFNENIFKSLINWITNRRFSYNLKEIRNASIFVIENYKNKSPLPESFYISTVRVFSMLNEKEKFIPLLNDGLRYYPFSTDLNMYKSDFLLSEDNILDSLKILIKTKTLFKKKLTKEFKRRVEIAVSTAEKIVKHDLKIISNKKLVISIQKSVLDLMGKQLKAEHFWNLFFLGWNIMANTTVIKIKENLSYIHLLSNKEASKISFYSLKHTINNRNNSFSWYITCLILIETYKLKTGFLCLRKASVIFPESNTKWNYLRLVFLKKSIHYFIFKLPKLYPIKFFNLFFKISLKIFFKKSLN